MATFYNQATLSYNGTVKTSNTVTGEIVQVLSATKAAVVGEYAQGGQITYIISILNSGGSAYTNLTVTDDLGAYTLGSTSYTPLTYTAGSIQYYVNGVLQTAPAVTAGPPLVITGISIPADGNAMLVYEVNVNQYAPLETGTSITNSAVVAGSGLTESVLAQETVTPQNAPNLSISKSVSPSRVTENGQLTYTFIVSNSGNTAADTEDNVVVSDTFDPVLNGITMTVNGDTVAADTTFTYSSATGMFSTTAGAITVPAATFTQDQTTGVWTVSPGITTITVSGTV